MTGLNPGTEYDDWGIGAEADDRDFVPGSTYFFDLSKK